MRVRDFVLAAALGFVLSFGGTAVYAEGKTTDLSQVVDHQTDVKKQAAPSEQQAKDAGLDAVKAAFDARFPDLNATRVRATPVEGLYEVQVGMDLIYVDAAVDYVFQGALIDVETRTDLTAARIQKLSEVPFESLPLELAVRVVRGDGSRKLAMFEDPNCVYCKQLHASLKDIDNVTLYSFLFPILSPDSVSKARRVWCASDQGKVWLDWMLDGKEPPAADCDDNPVEQVMALGRELMVRGTPALFFEDGSRMNGALPTDQLEFLLDGSK